MKSRVLTLPLALGLLLSGLPLGACSSDKNHEERARAVPPTQGTSACVGACNPDPGSKAVDCAKEEAGYQFYWVWNLKDPAAGGEGRAITTYTYDDATTTFVNPAHNAWEPTPIDVDRCGADKALHFFGGPFTSYGGGFGKNFLVPPADCAAFGVCPAEGSTLPNVVNAGDYDGIALWVRRGPDGQGSLRIAVSERHSADDLNLNNENCGRFRSCSCPVGIPCSPADDSENPMLYCFDPETDPARDKLNPDGSAFVYTTCGTTKCEEQTLGLPDPLFSGRACTSAALSDGQSGQFCYNPESDPLPPARRQRCGNSFGATVRVGTDWQLLKVPFSELRQDENSLRADDFDPSTIRQLLFTYTAGWVDVYLANAGFYRRL